MNIYVGNLSFDVTEADLQHAFEAFGTVAPLNVMKGKFSGQSKGFGFVKTNRGRILFTPERT